MKLAKRSVFVAALLIRDWTEEEMGQRAGLLGKGARYQVGDSVHLGYSGGPRVITEILKQGDTEILVTAVRRVTD